MNPILTLLLQPLKGVVTYARTHWHRRRRDVATVWTGEAKERFPTAREEEAWLTSVLTVRLRQHGDVITADIDAHSSNKKHYQLTRFVVCVLAWTVTGSWNAGL